MGRTGGIDHRSATTDLARSSVAELELAWEHRQVLVSAARTLVTAAGHDPDLAACAAASCGLATLGADPSICQVADRLTRVPGAGDGVGDGVGDGGADVPLEMALVGFLAALTASADAIRYCRQTAHVGAGCWFSSVAGLDGCGEVLRLLHRCG